MPTVTRAALLLLPLAISSCAWIPQRDRGPLPPPNPPVYCYDTIGRAACYDEPQNGLGELISIQVPPMEIVAPVIAPAPIILTPAQSAVLTPAQIEAMPDAQPASLEPPLEPIVIRNPDPYPAPDYKPR